MIRDLPELLVAADQVQSTANGDREKLLGYVSVYVAGAKLLTKLGSADLAAVAADRAAMTAGTLDSYTAQGMAIYQVVCALLRSDRTDEAEALAVTMAERLTPYVQSDEPSLLSITGALWLIAAVIAGRNTDRAQAWRRLDQADALAQLLGTDANYAWTAFGPTNVAIHRVSVAESLARRDGRRVLILDAWTSNSDLHAYYESQGFRYVRTVLGHYTPSATLFKRPVAPDTGNCHNPR